MRDRVKIEFGGVEHFMLPTFAVWDEFEDSAGVSLFEHLEQLYNGRALINVRARLIMLGLKANSPEKAWSLQRVKEAMFARGAWHESLVGIEADFIQTMLFTPEQYTEKKRQREEAEKAMRENERLLGSTFEAFSPPPQQP